MDSSLQGRGSPIIIFFILLKGHIAIYKISSVYVKLSNAKFYGSCYVDAGNSIGQHNLDYQGLLNMY